MRQRRRRSERSRARTNAIQFGGESVVDRTVSSCSLEAIGSGFPDIRTPILHGERKKSNPRVCVCVRARARVFVMRPKIRATQRESFVGRRLALDSPDGIEKWKEQYRHCMGHCPNNNAIVVLGLEYIFLHLLHRSPVADRASVTPKEDSQPKESSRVTSPATEFMHQVRSDLPKVD